MDKIVDFIKRRYLLIILIIYAAFIAFYKLSGSLQGDEAIYAQTARETLGRDSFLSLYWRGEIWLEKPPLYIWILMLVMKIFGHNEAAFWAINGVFLVVLSGFLFQWVKKITKNSFLAFFSGIILLSIPIFIKFSRSAMTDLGMTFFMFLSLYFLFFAVNRSKKQRQRLILFWVFLALAMMMKNIIPLFCLIIAALFLMYKKKLKLLWSRDSLFGLVLFLIITLPWHLIMLIKYKLLFINQYLGFHVLSRAADSVINSPYDDISFSYLKILFNFYGIWPLFGGFLLVYLVVNYKKIRQSLSAIEIDALIIALIWFFSILISFSLAKTKSPHYILPLAPAMAIFISVGLNYFCKTKGRDLMFFGYLALLNLTAYFSLNYSDYGESNILISAILFKIFAIDFGDLYFFFVVFLAILTIGIYLLRHSKHLKSLILVFIIFLNISVPFEPERGQAEKNLANFLKTEFNNRSLNIYLYENNSNEIDYFTNTLLYYLPSGSDTETYHLSQIEFLKKAQSDKLTFCLLPKNDKFYFDYAEFEITEFQNQAIIPCKSKEDLEPKGRDCIFCID